MVSGSGRRLTVNISSKTPNPDRGSPDAEPESQPQLLEGGRPCTTTSRQSWGSRLGDFPTLRCHGAESDSVTLSLTTSAANLRLDFSLSLKRDGCTERFLHFLLAPKSHTRFVDLQHGTGPPWLRNSSPGFPFWEGWVRPAVSS